VGLYSLISSPHCVRSMTLGRGGPPGRSPT
jgi:hypothetical protein